MIARTARKDCEDRQDSEDWEDRQDCGDRQDCEDWEDRHDCEDRQDCEDCRSSRRTGDPAARRGRRRDFRDCRGLSGRCILTARTLGPSGLELGLGGRAGLGRLGFYPKPFLLPMRIERTYFHDTGPGAHMSHV